MRTRIISFHNGNIPQEVLTAQKSVFDHFNLPLEQIETGLQHPDAIDHFLNTEEWDLVIIFDIDCIPLYPMHLHHYEIEYAESKRLVGAIQHASHIHNSKDYVSPAFMILSRTLWEELGKPSFNATYRGDVGAELTYLCIEKGLEVLLMKIDSVVKPMWKLSDGSYFGIGTTYHGGVFHAFESRMNESARNIFIDKCREVIAS